MASKVLVALICFAGCSAPREILVPPQVVPAKEFSKAVEEGNSRDFTIFDVNERTTPEQPPVARPSLKRTAAAGEFQGDQRYLQQGYTLHASVPLSEQITTDEMVGDSRASLRPYSTSAIPPGSRAPYYLGQMSGNPSLWPDEGQANFLYRDVRAFQPMDIVTIVVNEKAEGAKKAETDTETKFSLLLAVANFFGLESKSWAANNTGLDPENLVNATSNQKFEGEGETKRKGSLTAKISAIVLEALPNGLLRVEGTKIVSVDREEEVMVISGLVRPRDITADNEVQSSRVANMRIDFYGRGVVGDTVAPGWLARIFSKVWPF